MNIDPKFDSFMVTKIFHDLVKNGFYKKYAVDMESSIINLILKAQGNFKRKYPAKTNKFIDREKV